MRDQESHLSKLTRMAALPFQWIGAFLLLIGAGCAADRGLPSQPEAQSLHGGPIVGALGLREGKTKPATQATPEEAQYFKRQIEMSGKPSTVSVGLRELLEQIPKSRDKAERDNLIHEYLHAAFELQPEERSTALKRLHAVTEETQLQEP